MKQIILIRHAKVIVNEKQKIHAKELIQWVKEYDQAPIDDTKPSHLLYKIVQDTDIVLTSDLKRSIESAKLLGVIPHETNALFNEAGIPDAYLFPFKLRPKTWLFILRSLLLFGFGNKDHSLQASKIQAQKAADYLIEYSQIHNHVTLIGHGGMNWLIHKALIQAGWILTQKPSHQNWGITLLTKS